jgi:ADP-ribose pyrophosphatase YjhB (NUDIX family)
MATHCAFAVILDRHARVLLCRRKKDGKWNLPGGAANAHEAPWDAVVREVREELNVDVQINRVCGVYHVPGKDDVVLTFACQIISGKPRPGDEVEELGWFAPLDLPETMRERHAERVLDALDTVSVAIRSES